MARTGIVEVETPGLVWLAWVGRNQKETGSLRGRGEGGVNHRFHTSTNGGGKGEPWGGRGDPAAERPDREDNTSFPVQLGETSQGHDVHREPADRILEPSWVKKLILHQGTAQARSCI